MLYFRSLLATLSDASDQIAFESILEQATQANSDLPSGDFGSAFVRMLLSLLVLILLMIGTVWFLRKIIRGRLEKGSGGQSIHLIEKKMISPKTMLYIVEVDGKRVLLAESQLEIKQIQVPIASATDMT